MMRTNFQGELWRALKFETNEPKVRLESAKCKKKKINNTFLSLIIQCVVAQPAASFNAATSRGGHQHKTQVDRHSISKS